MALTYGWLGLGLLVALLVVAGVAWSRALRERRVGDDVLWLAHVDRVSRLPRYQELARRRVRWLRVELAMVVVAVVGAVLLVSRPVVVSTDSREMKSRDVMLCLDVSASMRNADQVVLRSYLSLVDRLQGERIGLVVWNSTGAMAFPLTDDYEFVQERLRSVLAAFGDTSTGGDAAEGQAALSAAELGEGTSLIGDGLVSCLQRFDQRAEDRPRTVVLATDNELSGPSIFSLAEAGAMAVEEDVLVYGIVPGELAGPQRDELEDVVASTGGELLDITTDPAMEERIVRGVEQQQRQAIRDVPTARSFDLVWPGAALLAIGLAGLLLAVTRGRR